MSPRRKPRENVKRGESAEESSYHRYPFWIGQCPDTDHTKRDTSSETFACERYIGEMRGAAC